MDGLIDWSSKEVDAAITSPCTGVCVIDPASGWCEGCGRTLDEIARWGTASAAEREMILAQLPKRIKN